MRNTLQLQPDGIIDFFFPVPMNVAPERGHAVQVLSSLHVDQVVALAARNDTWLFPHPFLHLRERMPEVSVVELFKSFVVQRHYKIL